MIYVVRRLCLGRARRPSQSQTLSFLYSHALMSKVSKVKEKEKGRLLTHFYRNIYNLSDKHFLSS